MKAAVATLFGNSHEVVRLGFHAQLSRLALDALLHAARHPIASQRGQHHGNSNHGRVAALLACEQRKNHSDYARISHVVT